MKFIPSAFRINLYRYLSIPVDYKFLPDGSIAGVITLGVPPPKYMLVTLFPLEKDCALFLISVMRASV